MSVNRSLLNWGVFLIALGGIPLAVDQGWIESDIARDLGQLWPLILVGIGLGLILRWTPFAWFGGGLVAATFGIIFGAAIVALPDDEIGGIQDIIPAFATGACAGDEAGPATTSAGSVANPETFRLDATLSCGDLSVARADDATWSFEAVHASDDAPTVDESDLDGATAYVGLGQDGRDELVFFGTQAQSDWDVTVPSGAALTTALTLNAANAQVDAGSGPLTTLESTFNASNATIDLASADTPTRARVDLTANAADVLLLLPDGDLDADISLNASSFELCVPVGAALRVDYTAPPFLSNHDFDSKGLEETGSEVWTTTGFSDAVERIELSISSNVSSVNLERPETCS